MDEARPGWRTVCLGLPKGGRGGRMGDVHLGSYVRAVYPHLEGAVASRGSTRARPVKEKMVLMYTIISAFALYFGSFLLICSIWEANLRMIAASLYLAFATVVAYTRYMTRTGLGIQQGDAMTDVCLSVCFYPLVLLQCEEECALGTIGGAPAQEKAKERRRRERARERAASAPLSGRRRLSAPFPRDARAQRCVPPPA